MNNFNIAYIPIGVPTFHLESAQILFDSSIKLLEKKAVSVKGKVIAPDRMLLSLDLLKDFLRNIKEKGGADLVILQNVTFANAAYSTEIAAVYDGPLLLWTLREPVIDGGRLRLNSLTGAYSASHTISAFRKENKHSFEFVYGSPEEEKVIRTIEKVLKVAALKKTLSEMTLLQVGHTPQGFGFGRADDTQIRQTFGVNLSSIEARELINTAKKFTDEDIITELEAAEKEMPGLSETAETNRKDFARLLKAYMSYCRTNNIRALSSRCWPDFFTDFGTPVCAVLAMLNDAGIAASCEADTYGALSMFCGSELTQKPVFFGDPVSLDEEENTITFWHCGTAACSLAREDTGAEVGVHCNRKIGPTLDFGCKASERVTIFRIGKDAFGNFRFFIKTGSALDKPKQFTGTTIVVKTDEKSEEIVYTSVLDGFEPHFAVIYGDVSSELTMLAHFLNIAVV